MKKLTDQFPKRPLIIREKKFSVSKHFKNHEINMMQSAEISRRPKKRPSFGVRTVELTRGQLGFGFTLQVR